MTYTVMGPSSRHNVYFDFDCRRKLENRKPLQGTSARMFFIGETRKERFLCTLIIWGMFCGLLLEKGQVVVPDFGRMSFPG